MNRKIKDLINEQFTTILYFCFVVLMFGYVIISESCHGKKKQVAAATDTTVVDSTTVPVSDSILNYTGECGFYVGAQKTYSIAIYDDSTGVIQVFNKKGKRIFKGNVNDTVPCKKCKSISLCERYRRENLRLWKKLQGCEKGDYYVPSNPLNIKQATDTTNDPI